MNPNDGGFGGGGYDGGGPGRRRQPKKSNTSTILLIVAGVLVLVGAILIGQAVFSGDGDAKSKVPIPTLVGKTLTEAETLATNAGVKVAQSSSERCDQPKNAICSQNPAPEAGEMSEGDTINVVVSEGAPKVEVPDVTDKDLKDATRLLEDKGFKVGDPKQVESDEDPGTVLEQDPAGNAQAEKGAEVTLTIAKQALVDVRDVTNGQQFDSARSQLEDTLGFTVKRVDVDSDQPAGIVVKQDPPAAPRPRRAARSPFRSPRARSRRRSPYRTSWRESGSARSRRSSRARGSARPSPRTRPRTTTPSSSTSPRPRAHRSTRGRPSS